MHQVMDIEKLHDLNLIKKKVEELEDPNDVCECIMVLLYLMPV